MNWKTLLLGVVLFGVIWYLTKLNYATELLEIKTSVQIGMTEKQATAVMGNQPRVIKSGEKINSRLTFSDAIRSPHDKVLLYSGYPSSYVVVHVNPKGTIDAILFMES